MSTAATKEGKRIVRCGLLANHTRSQVQRQTGPPGERSAREWTYLLGEENGLVAMDSYFLTLTFRKGRVLQASVRAG